MVDFKEDIDAEEDDDELEDVVIFFICKSREKTREIEYPPTRSSLSSNSIFTKFVKLKFDERKRLKKPMTRKYTLKKMSNQSKNIVPKYLQNTTIQRDRQKIQLT